MRWYYANCYEDDDTVVDSVWTVADKVDDIVDGAVVCAVAVDEYDLLVLLLARSTFYWAATRKLLWKSYGSCDFLTIRFSTYSISTR